MRGPWQRRVIVAVTALFLRPANAQPQPRTEHEVKAAYLYTFGRFVEWPASRSGDEFTICILGADPFGPVLDMTLKGTTVRGRTVVARRLSSLERVPACHILFISASEQPHLDAIFTALQGANVLTVSDIPQFVGRGGTIQFETVERRVRFKIDLRPAIDAGLTLRSELLRVATSVEGRPSR